MIFSIVYEIVEPEPFIIIKPDSTSGKSRNTETDQQDDTEEDRKETFYRNHSFELEDLELPPNEASGTLERRFNVRIRMETAKTKNDSSAGVKVVPGMFHET